LYNCYSVWAMASNGAVRILLHKTLHHGLAPSIRIASQSAVSALPVDMQ